MEYDRLTVCLPAFNEEDAVEPLLKELKEELPGAEIIFVDDGSTDRTLKRAGRVEGVIVLSHGRNMGYGAALKTAMRRAKGEFIAWCDTDGQHRAEDLKTVAAPVMEGEKDAVIGRRAKGSKVTLGRIPGKMIIKMVAEMVARQKIPDLNSGMRCFRRDVIKRYLHLLPDGFSASTTSTLILIKQGYRLGYEEIRCQARQGVSTVSILRDGWQTLTLILRMLILFDAFGFFTLLASIQITTALIYGLYIAFTNRLGFPTLAATVLISGILTFFMGLICDQLVALRKERFEDLDSGGS
jgi:glycosyltransferase involved in cell wall biosynthesis